MVGKRIWLMVIHDAKKAASKCRTAATFREKTKYAFSRNI